MMWGVSVVLGVLISVVVGIPPSDCPIGGVYMSPDGNDATGTGTDHNPYKTFQKSLESLKANNTSDGVICLLAGTYTEVPSIYYTYGPFHSIRVLPAYLTAFPLPTLDTFWFSLHNIKSVEISHLDIRNLSFYASHSNIHLHDIQGAPAKIALYDVSTEMAPDFILDGIYGAVSLNIATQNLVHSVSLLSSDFRDISIDSAANVTLSKCALSSYVTIFHPTILTVTNCSASNLILTQQRNLNFISVYPIKDVLVNITNNLFFNISLYTQTKSTTNLFLINSFAYTLNYVNNYLKCNEGRSMDYQGIYPLPYIPFSVDNPSVKANIVNNVDVPCIPIL